MDASDETFPPLDEGEEDAKEMVKLWEKRKEEWIVAG